MSATDIKLEEFSDHAFPVGSKRLKWVATFHAIEFDMVTGHQNMTDLLSKTDSRDITLKGEELDQTFARLHSPNFDMAFGIARG